MKRNIIITRAAGFIGSKVARRFLDEGFNVIGVDDLSGGNIKNVPKEVDFIEIHAFGCQPKSPNPLVDPEGYAAEQKRLREAYADAYRNFFQEYLPDNGLPSRFTVHVVDVPDAAASYEFYGTALYQKELQRKKE